MTRTGGNMSDFESTKTRARSAAFGLLLPLVMRGVIVCLLLAAGVGRGMAAASPLSPCEALGAADAVFIGEAEPVATRLFSQGGLGPDYSLKVSPVRVEAVFRGVTSDRVYLAPAGLEVYLVPGQKYVIYGRHYNGPDTFMTAEAYGTKLLSDAQADLEFLAASRARGTGAIITGILDRDESSSASPGTEVSPLPDTAVLLTKGNVTVMSRTERDGTFTFTGLSKGIFTASVQLPPDLHLLNNPDTQIPVQSDGCVPLKLRVVPNGHIRGALLTADGKAARFETVSLMPVEVRDDGRDGYVQQVRTDEAGLFAFDGVRPGRYQLGRLAYTADGKPVPSVYYPGTLERAASITVLIGRAAEVWVGEFRLVTPAVAGRQ